MAKHAKNPDHLQLVDAPKTAMVEIPLPHPCDTGCPRNRGELR